MLGYLTKKKLYCICAMLCVLLSTTSCRKKTTGENGELQELVFASANSVWWTAPTIVAVTDDLFSKHKLKVKTFDVMTGLASKNAVISGVADVGLVATTPLAMGAFKEEPIQILGRYVMSDNLIAIVTSKQNNLDTSDECNAVQEVVAIVPNTISEWYLYNFLRDANNCDQNNLKKMQAGELGTVNLRPQDIPNVMKNGNAKSAVIWEPFVTKMIQEGNGTKYSVLRKNGVYTMSLYLVTRPDVIKNKPREIKAFVETIRDACDMSIDPAKGIQGKIEDYFKEDSGYLDKLWTTVDFSFQQDSGVTEKDILNEIEIAKALGRTPDKNEDELKKYISSICEYMRSSGKK